METNNFWNNHTLNDFQLLSILDDIHSSEIFSVCFLKDGRIASSSRDNNVLIYNKRTFKIEIRIRERKSIFYMNINRDGILITCMRGTYVNLYEIKGKRYSNIQTIRPYSLKFDIIGIFDGAYYIKKFIELKNGDIAILDRGYTISFYKKKKKSKKYSYLNQFKEDEDGLEIITDLCELDDNQYCLNDHSGKLIKFLDWNKKIITDTIEFEKNFYNIDTNSELLLMNKKDLFVTGSYSIIIVDVQKKEIIKKLDLHISGYLTYIGKLSDNIIIAGFWNDYIGQFEYDKNTKNLKLISNIGEKHTLRKSAIYDITSISIFKNNLIVSPYKNSLYGSSLIVYQLKNK